MPLSIDIGNLRKNRPALYALKKFLQISARPLCDNFNPEILQVAHISNEREMLRVLRDEIAIRNTLHLARDDATYLCRFHVRAEGFEPPTFRV